MKWWTWLIAGAWLGLIYFMGTSRFGRNRTQYFIDMTFTPGSPLKKFVNRQHGRLRAAFHYLEFITLSIVLYWALGGGSVRWHDGRGALVAVMSVACAYLDEWHQSRTPGRQFRRIDFMHSLMGVAIAMLALFLHSRFRH